LGVRRRRKVLDGGTAMRAVSVSVVSFLAVLTAGPTGRAADLTQIERRIGKEPAYQTRSPAYCLLAFGPGAKARVWLVYDDAAGLLYLDRNGDGNLTDHGEVVKASSQKTSTFDDLRVKAVRFEVGRLREPGGQAEHANVLVEMQVFRGRNKEFFLPAARVSMDTNGKLRQEAGFGKFTFAPRPARAPVLHFNGPLTLFLALEPHRQVDLTRGQLNPARAEVRHLAGDPVDFRVNVGTPGLGDDAWVKLTTDGPPADVHPAAEIEFPSRQGPKQRVRRRYELRERC
jgi:hypothetical protein